MVSSEHDLEVVVGMLRRFRSAQETLVSSGDRGGGNPLLMPVTWTLEMRELERGLGLLARRRPFLHRQVMARYVDPVVCRRTVRGRVGRAGSSDVMTWLDLGPHCEVVSFAKLPEHARSSEYTCLVASWPSWVLKTQVALGVALLAEWFVAPSAVGPALPVVRDDSGRASEMAA